jgi:hypothetical protein
MTATTMTTLTTLPIAEQIAFFFAPPLPPQSGPALSTLYLNRQEAQDSLIGTVVPEAEVVRHGRKLHRLFATTMVIAAGVDLLAKFYAGADHSGRKGGVADRIIGFAERFMFRGAPLGHTLAEVFYEGCRNPMLHSFTLENTKFVMSLTDQMEAAPIWRAKAPDSAVSYLLSVPGLYLAYVATIARYQSALAADAVLQANFAKMFPTYGFIEVWSATVTPIERAR